MRRMRRQDFDSDGLSSGSFEDGEGEINPNAYLTNLADCMLVLSVGFMVALVAAWNVNLPSATQVKSQDMTEVNDVQKMANNIASSGSSYNKLGEVYQDPTTGKMYMLEKDTESSKGKSTSSSSK